MFNEKVWRVKSDRREIIFLYNYIIDGLDNSERKKKMSYPRKQIDVMASELDDYVDSLLLFSSKARRLNEFKDILDDECINYESDSFNSKVSIKNLMLELFNINCLPEVDFTWISDDSRMCDCILVLLRMLKRFDGEHRKLIMQDIVLADENTTFTRPNRLGGLLDSGYYERMKFPEHPNGGKDKINCIITFFDLIDISKHDKRMLMDAIHGRWHSIKNNSKMISWINKNESLIDWAWDYVLKKHLNSTFPFWVHISGTEKIDITRQKKQALITLYDTLKLEHQLILMNNISKGGSQQKFRINIEGRKSIQLYIRHETKEKLDKLVADKDKKIYQVIEDLIEQAYSKEYLERG